MSILEIQAAQCPPDDHSPVLPATGPQVVVAYEDFQTAVKLQSLLQHIAEERCNEVSSITAFWKFDLLMYAPLLEQAIGEVRRADIIIVSAHGNSALPPQVMRWVELSLLEQASHASKLIVMLDESAEYTAAADRALACLSSIADRAHLKWLPVFSVCGEVPPAFVRLIVP
jgi:hypothetical protein